MLGRLVLLRQTFRDRNRRAFPIIADNGDLPSRAMVYFFYIIVYKRRRYAACLLAMISSRGHCFPSDSFHCSPHNPHYVLLY